MLEKLERIQENAAGQADEARELLEHLEHGVADGQDGLSDTEGALGLQNLGRGDMKTRKHRLDVLSEHDIFRHAPAPRAPQQERTYMVQCLDVR